MDYILRQIRQLPAEMGNLRRLVKRTGMSERHFRRLFREHMGIPVRTFMRIYRFYRGFWLLQSGKFHSLTEIAHDAGYFDQAHFIRDFREYTGSS